MQTPDTCAICSCVDADEGGVGESETNVSADGMVEDIAASSSVEGSGAPSDMNMEDGTVDGAPSDTNMEDGAVDGAAATPQPQLSDESGKADTMDVEVSVDSTTSVSGSAINSQAPVDPSDDTLARFRQMVDELDDSDNPTRALKGFAYETFGPSGIDRLMESAFYDDGTSEHGVDLAGVREVYKGLCTGPHGDEVQEILASAIGNTVSLELLRRRSFPSVRSLRVFLILFEAPVFHDMSALDSLLPALLKSMAQLREGERAVLARWWAAEPVAELSIKLALIQQFITLRVLMHDERGYNMNQDEDLGGAVKTVGILHLANSYLTPADQLTELEFVNDGLSSTCPARAGSFLPSVS
jgi:hypothetical protein